MEEIMDIYISISKINLSEFSELYRDLDLLTDFRKKKEKLYNDVFNYIWDLFRKIDAEVDDFNIYKNEFQNYPVNYKKIRNLQKNFFHYEEISLDEKTSIPNIDDFGIDCPYFASTNHYTNKQYIIINKITGYLRMQYQNIGKLTYFDKDYDAHFGRKKTKRSHVLNDLFFIIYNKFIRHLFIISNDFTIIIFNF